jgi:hypothetical protein
MFKERYEKSTCIIAQTHYTVIFSLSLNRNREVSRGGYGLVNVVIFYFLVYYFP